MQLGLPPAPKGLAQAKFSLILMAGQVRNLRLISKGIQCQVNSRGAKHSYICRFNLLPEIVKMQKKFVNEHIDGRKFTICGEMITKETIKDKFEIEGEINDFSTTAKEHYRKNKYRNAY